MRTKKFKTVSGYLRSADNRLQYDLPKDRDQRIAAVRSGQRDIINNLLPQLGLSTTIDVNEKPSDGIARMLAAGGTEQQVKALKDCQRWLKNYVVVMSATVTVVPQVKTAQGLVSYRVDGFKRSEHGSRTIVIVDADPNCGIMEGRPHHIAEALAGPDYCFHSSQNINHSVPDAAKNRLLTEEELYAAVPEMNPRARGRGGRS